MGWADLLQTEDDEVVLPWTGGRSAQLEDRVWKIVGDLPREHAWCVFRVEGRKARAVGVGEPRSLPHQVVGYLVGDRLVRDDASAAQKAAAIVANAESVHLVEPGLDRFVRIRAGRAHETGPLVYLNQEMPLGPEGEALKYFEDGGSDIDRINIWGASPALYAALAVEIFHRAEATRRREELEKFRREEEERLIREERRREITKKLGDGVGRREMAVVDFATAARAALLMGNAEYLDHRRGIRASEMVVKFRLDGRRFECVCDSSKLRIIDSGICLTAHDDEDFEDGTKGDGWLTLESLPSVILQADREGKLVVLRHAEG